MREYITPSLFSLSLSLSLSLSNDIRYFHLYVYIQNTRKINMLTPNSLFEVVNYLSTITSIPTYFLTSILE